MFRSGRAQEEQQKDDKILLKQIFQRMMSLTRHRRDEFVMCIEDF
jgi:hypothetical protein